MDVFYLEELILDLILVLGVVFDVEKLGYVWRLGYGKGFYDFFINWYFVRVGDYGFDDMLL